MTNRFVRSLFLILYIAISVGCTAPTPTSTPTPLPTPVAGSSGIGDPYYPDWGNGGYDVQSYTISLDIDPPANTIRGSTIIQATASEYLSPFNLDFHGLTVDSVTVNDAVAQFSRNEDELTIMPASPLEVNDSFSVAVEYHGSPELFKSQAFPYYSMGWSHAENGAINVIGEPEAASSWFPNNNHPSDKATYRFEITVPNPWIVAATGTLKDTKSNEENTLFIWEMDKPMATYVASISIDQYEIVTQSGPNGLTIRNYFPIDFPAERRINYNSLAAMIDLFDDFFGPYPFEEYGVVVASKDGWCAATDMALEAQSMSVHCPGGYGSSEFVIEHELAHQWFGNSVSLENWKDVWLKEGFATYADWLWESKSDPVALMRIAKREQRNFLDNPRYSVAEPSPDDLYTDSSYIGGALVLQGLRLEVGDETFFDILRTYVERYQYGVAGTDEFIDLAKEVSGKDLKPFFDKWLFSKTIPKLPE